MSEVATAPLFNIQSEAGPSRPSPVSSLRSPPGPTAELETVIGEETSGGAVREENGSASEEAVQLLLSISSIVDQRPPPPVLERIAAGEFVTSPTKPFDVTYPYTPPDDPQIQHMPPLSTLASDSNTQLFAFSSGELQPLTSVGAHPEPIVKPKARRKRNSQAGLSRRTSTDRPSLDRDRPPHWMGEDNTTIRCICGVAEDDGFTIQCEGCGAWEHGQCFGYLDEASAPETYFCELCTPREIDAFGARQRQMASRMQYDAKRAAALAEEGSVPEKERGKPRSKPKQSRTGSVIDGEGELRDIGNDPSPSVMGPPPPTAKPKRRPTSSKPRPKQSNADATPGPACKEAVPPLELEDEYFGVEPWALEYTPIKENVVRGKLARQIMGNVYREWVDVEDEAISDFKRPQPTPSGLPSPTETGVLRLSPENFFSSPDFSILAPPIPPVSLTSVDLEFLSAPTSVHAIHDSSSFLPLSYVEVSSSGVYTRPALYGVYADEPISTGSFVGDFRGEIVDCETYRRDPINQYPGLGMPKPYVRSIGPPVNLMIDARGYGCELRYIRSGCHPNVVIRPLLWRHSDSHVPKLKFGVFASTDIGKKEEIVLGWEWDDQHVVHSMRSVIIPTAYDDLSLGIPQSAISGGSFRTVAFKFEAVLTHLTGTFSTCACSEPAHCALAQMRHIVEGKVSAVSNGRRAGRADLGELVGAVRGWRRREVEADAARRWAMPGAFEVSLSRSKTLELSEDQVTNKDKTPVVKLDDHPPLTGGIQHRGCPVPEPASSQDSSQGLSSDIEDVIEVEGSPDPVSAAEKMTFSSLFSAASTRPPPPPSVGPDFDMDVDDGHQSDATTATVPRSHFSGSDNESESRVPMEETRKAAINGKRGRRVFSPVSERVNIKSPVEKNGKKTKTAQTLTVKAPAPMKPLSKGQTSPDSAVAPRSRKHRVIVSSPPSEDERMDIGETPRSPIGVVLPPKGSQNEETLAVVHDTMTPPISAAREAIGVFGDIAAEQMMTAEEARLEREPTPPRVPTLPPKEATPPPPEPPKKVSLSDYLKSHKIRKESSLTAPPTLPKTPAVETSFDEIPGFASSSNQVKTEPEPISTRVNLFEHLPSSRTPGTPSQMTPSFTVASSATEILRPLVVPSEAYAPRAEYMPNQAVHVPIFASHVISSYTPRPMSTPIGTETPPPPNVPNYAPRQVSDTPPMGYLPRPQIDAPPPFLSRPPEDRHIPLLKPEPSLPSPPANRVPPPPTPQNLMVPRAPPTGPRVPPTGPRGAWNPTASPAVVGSGPGAPTRGFGGRRGGFGGDRGGYAGERGAFVGDRAGFAGERAGFGGDRGGFVSDRGGFGERGGFVERGGFSRGRGGSRGRGRGG